MKRVLFLTTFMVFIFGIGPEVLALGTEDFGNAPLGDANYHDWKGVMPVINHSGRVYHSWVNGNEHFYYEGDTSALNDALSKFAAIKADVREVIIRPGPGKARTFHGEEVRCDWLLHIQGGISRHMVSDEKDTNIWDKYPTTTVFVGDTNIELERIELPKGLVILELADLRARYLKGLESDDREVRGYAAYYLAKVDPHNKDNVAAIAKLLDEKDDWVRSMATGALGQFGKEAELALPALRKALESTNEKEHLKKRFREVIETIEDARDRTEALREHRATLVRISKFRESLDKDLAK